MSREADRVAIATFLSTNWNTAVWGPLGWPNTSFSPPVNSRWASVEILDFDLGRTSLGPFYNLRYEGAVQIDMYMPEAGGTKPLRVTADELFDLFNEIIIPTSDDSALHFYTPRFRAPTPNEIRAGNLDDNWYRYTMTASFRKDKTLSI